MSSCLECLVRIYIGNTVLESFKKQGIENASIESAIDKEINNYSYGHFYNKPEISNIIEEVYLKVKEKLKI